MLMVLHSSDTKDNFSFIALSMVALNGILVE